MRKAVLLLLVIGLAFSLVVLMGATPLDPQRPSDPLISFTEDCRQMPPVDYPEYAMDSGRTFDEGFGYRIHDRSKIKVREVVQRLMGWAVRPAIIWYLDTRNCPVYAGFGTAFAYDNWDGFNNVLWVSVDHVNYPMKYENEWVKINYSFRVVEVEGYQMIPIWDNGEVVFSISTRPTGVLPFRWLWSVWNSDDPDFLAKEIWIGEPGYSLGWTVHAEVTGYGRYKRLYHVPTVVKGEVMSVAEYKGLLGADFFADLNGIAGMSGGPFVVFRPDNDGRITYGDFKLVGVTNIGAGSGPLGYYMIPPDIPGKLKEWWESRKDIKHEVPGTGEPQTGSTEMGPKFWRVPAVNPFAGQGFFLPVWRYPETYDQDK
jgi:hypothetical protein